MHHQDLAGNPVYHVGRAENTAAVHTAESDTDAKHVAVYSTELSSNPYSHETFNVVPSYVKQKL